MDRNIFQMVGVQRSHAEYSVLQTSSLFWNRNSANLADNVSQPSIGTLEQRGGGGSGAGTRV